MVSAVLAAMAVGVLPVVLQPQDYLPDVTWHTHAVATMPQGWVKSNEQLYLVENNKPVISQVEVVARWPDGSPKWVHAYAPFRYAGGQGVRYQLVKQREPPGAAPKSPLAVTDDASGITVDTGAVRFTIGRPFAGITTAEFGGTKAIIGAGGPSLIDGRGLIWLASEDDKAEVVVEQQGPAQVTVKATGWYQTHDRRVEPFCRFVTRITAFAGSPLVKFDHATIFAGDMRKHAIAELAFKFPLADVQGFVTGSLNGKLPDKSESAWFAQVSADKLVALTEKNEQEVREPHVTGTLRRSPGWFTAELAAGRVALLTKDFWEKYPKEVKISRDELAYYAWPKHSELARPDETALRPDGVYKFQCFLTGDLLDSRLPSDYFTALELQTDTTECKAVYARAANMEGVAMHNEFALAFLPGAADGSTGVEYVSRLEKLYVQNPIAGVSPVVIAASGVFGPVAPAGREFADVEQAVHDGMLGYARSIERYADYGWAIYGNVHSEELMNPRAAGVPGGRPSLHRVWNNNHYQHVSTSWRLAALNPSWALWEWARLSTDNYASIGQVRYDSLRGYLDGDGVHRPGPSVKFHLPGAFWHCKGLVPWGCRDYGMDRDDSDANLTGHWPDPSALLWAWLLDGNRWAKDGYDLWRANVKFPDGGTRREINTSLVHAITTYEYEPDEKTLVGIKAMARSLSSVPIQQQRPGPIWEPTWLSRYHELVPDDEAFNKYLITCADTLGLSDEGIWTLALSATAYRITKNDAYLRRHAGTLARAVRGVFKDQAADQRWRDYGFGPGPIRDGHFMLQWHRFRAALADAKIDSLPAPEEPGHYLATASRFDNRDDVARRGTQILMLIDKEPASLTVEATTIGGGDMHATSLEVLSPRNQAILSIPRLPMTAGASNVIRRTRPSSWVASTEEYPLGEGLSPGLYRVLVGSHQIGLFQPISKFPECQLLRTSRQRNSSEVNALSAKLSRGYLVPLARGTIRLTFTAAGDRDGSDIALSDPRGKLLLDRHLRAGESASVNINGANDNGPWLLDAFSDHTGFFTMTIESNTADPLLYGRRLEDVQLIRQHLVRQN